MTHLLASLIFLLPACPIGQPRFFFRKLHTASASEFSQRLRSVWPQRVFEEFFAQGACCSWERAQSFGPYFGQFAPQRFSIATSMHTAPLRRDFSQLGLLLCSSLDSATLLMILAPRLTFSPCTTFRALPRAPRPCEPVGLMRVCSLRPAVLFCIRSESVDRPPRF
eukprot:944305-Pleurochrysis_carterae.AAC.2